jgi:type II secretory pathway pseudopilin PulG
MTRRGAILLEAIISVAIFVAAAITLIGILSQSSAVASRARDEQIASDLCRSALVELALGVRTPESLIGPVRPPDEDTGIFEDAKPADPVWELAISTEPSQFPGLIRVAVEAVKVGPRGDRRTIATLRQLVPSGAARSSGGAT